MGSAISAASGPISGLIGGAFSNQKEGATDAGNAYSSTYGALGGNNMATSLMQNAIHDQATVDPNADNAGAVQNGALTSGTFGKGGILDQTNQQESQQANQPWALTDQDKSAYGQISGDIARQFGQSDQSMSQALSDRGLSNSGVAGAAFSGAQGSKMEQLAGAQQKIANDRMQTNMQRLGQTQQFLGQLNNQANTDMNSNSYRNINQADQFNSVLTGRANMMNGLQGRMQTQNNTALQQQQGTAHGSTLGNMATGFAAGSMSGGGGGGGGDKTSGGKPQQMGQAGQSDINNSMFSSIA